VTVDKAEDTRTKITEGVAIMRNKHFAPMVVVLLTLCIFAIIPAWAQIRRMAQNTPGTQQQRDPLAFLKQALTKVGASALDSTQETELNTLITNFRNANKPSAPDAAEQAARHAYANAILAKDPTSATIAADNLASLLSARQRTMLEAEASFQIQALTYLHSDQVAALQSKVGNNGILRVLQSLIEPGFGPGMMGRPAMSGQGFQMRRGNPNR
jgi:hypothetical protein